MDWKKFRVYLKEKYNVEVAYLFIGFLEENQDLYLSLQKCGFILIFKETFKHKNGLVKGNCDAELVLQAMIDLERYSKAIIVSGDGDFACLVRYLNQKNKLETVIVPNRYKYSALLKKTAKKRLNALNDLKKKLSWSKKKRTP